MDLIIFFASVLIVAYVLGKFLDYRDDLKKEKIETVMVEVKCQWCGTSFVKDMSNDDGHGNFCCDYHSQLYWYRDRALAAKKAAERKFL
jgi:hypothetical protein